MPAPKSNGAEVIFSEGNEEPAAKGVIGLATNGKYSGKRERKPTKLVSIRSNKCVISEPVEVVKKRKCAVKQASKTGASPACTPSKSKAFRACSGLNGRGRSDKFVQDNDNQKESDCPPNPVTGETSRLEKHSGPLSRQKVRDVTESSTKFQLSVTPKSVPASTRINAPKTAQASAAPEENAMPGELEHRRRSKQRRKCRKMGDKVNVDEKMRIKRRVKNLVNRIRLEQNLLDAYAGEGWKGHSREKIRPEMELQRADMQIVRCKLAIRDLIRDLDNLGLEGSLQDSAFDEEGRVFHEEIFCAKCKSQEASIDNDIILCDGACDRGFHQDCLQPPLATVDIPPGDEGWLCPVCDNKVECLNYINGYLGTEFQLEDGWEKIFAAAAGFVDGVPNAMGADWPSEDSDDDDYDPEKKAVQDGNEEDDGGDLEQNTDVLTASESDPEGLSSSEITNDPSQSSDVSGDELGHIDRRLHGRDIKCEEVLNICQELEIPIALKAGDTVPLLGKRQRKAVDYKKLHAELFGKEDVDEDVHSEDEEWGPRKSKRENLELLNGIGWKEGDVVQMSVKQLVLRNKPNHVQRASFNRQQLDNGKSRRLPDSAVEILRKEFALGTSFPTRAYKESLTQTLGISFQQISSWFKNARHVAKHGTGQSSHTHLPKAEVVNGANSKNLRERSVEDIEITNGLLIEKLDEVQLKLRYLRQTLEAIGPKPDPGSESNLLGNLGDGEGLCTDNMVSCAKGKHVMYVPVAQVVEKDAAKAIGNQCV